MSTNEVIFASRDASGDDGLWISDGTVAGTYELTGIAGAGAKNFAPYDFTNLNGEAVFFGTGSNDKLGLWLTDGTVAGTKEITTLDGTDTQGGYSFDTLATLNGNVLFNAEDANGDYGLWVSGAAGVYELTGVSGASTNGLDPGELTSFGGKALFSGIDSSGDYGLWVTDGTVAGTHELIGIAGASATAFDPYNFTAFNGEVLFNGTDASGDASLWVTDGTAAGTYELTGIAGAGTGEDALNPQDLTVFNGEALFNGTDPSGNQNLWVTNGTAAGTYEISIPSIEDLDPYDITVFKGEALFGAVAYDGGELWATDGTAAGTHEIMGFSYAPTNLTVVGDEVEFTDDGALWVTDGTAAGTHELPEVIGAAPIFNPSSFMDYNGVVLFSGRDANNKQGLWVTNGTAAGTYELTGIAGASSPGLRPSQFTVYNNDVLFNAWDESGDDTLWVTNGTAAGTYELTGVAGGDTVAGAICVPWYLTVFDNEVLFTDVCDNGLWVTNGTAAGTYELTGIAGASASGFDPSDLTVFNSEVLFNGADSNGNRGLWVTNGAAAGTYELLEGTGAPSDPSGFTVCDGKVVFEAYGGPVAGEYLWVTDGTAAGTYELTGIAGASTGINQDWSEGLCPSNFTSFDGEALFSGYDSSGVAGLWVTDGTVSGTHELTGIAGASTGANVPEPARYYGLDPDNFVVFNGEALFRGFDSSGYEGLWATNGTAAGTYEIGADLDPTSLDVYDGEVLFNSGSEMWVTNGTAAGTHEVSYVAGGTDPDSLTAVTFGATTVSAATYLADKSALDEIAGGFEVSDTATNIADDLDQLDDGNIDAIVVSDNGAVGASVRQLTSDATAIGELKNADGSPYRLAITDSAAAVAADAAALKTLIAAGHVASLTRTNVNGQIYTTHETLYDASGNAIAQIYEGVTGEPYSSFEYDYAGGALIGSKLFCTGIAGQAYTSEETDYDGAGRLVRAAFGDVSGTPYSSYEYDYVGGVFAGSKFTYTSVPAGASYASYEVDYGYDNAFAGEKFFFANVTGQSYTGEELDFDANTALSRVVLTGVENESYASLELDYSAGTYEGYKAFYDISGQSYANEEVDVSASGLLEKVVYSGLSGTPYSSVEQDYSGGAPADTVYGYTDVTGQTYHAYQVTDDANGNGLQETFDLNGGGHTLIALTGGQTLTSLGNDKMTGDGATTFALDAIYGADVITNFTSADTISLSTSEFANFAALTSAAVQSGANVLITASDGDTLTLKAMTTAALAGMSASFAFHA